MSTRCGGDNKEKLSTNIHSEYASDFCHDRKSAFSLSRNRGPLFSQIIFDQTFFVGLSGGLSGGLAWEVLSSGFLSGG